MVEDLESDISGIADRLWMTNSLWLTHSIIDTLISTCALVVTRHQQQCLGEFDGLNPAH